MGDLERHLNPVNITELPFQVTPGRKDLLSALKSEGGGMPSVFLVEGHVIPPSIIMVYLGLNALV